MSLPSVVNLTLPLGNVSFIATTAGVATSFTIGNSSVGTIQQRVAFSCAAAESGSGVAVSIVGLNGNNATVSEVLALGNATTTAISNLDYIKIISLTPVNITTLNLTTTVGSVFAGTVNRGSSLWTILSWHVAPTNIEASGVIASANGVNWGVQYTYDDPNNLPVGTTIPFVFNHATLNAQTTSLDGSINDPVTAVRFIVNSGTGTLRGTVIQAGIGGP
jgi:hypothetical protein